jgi:hypothetical protein
MIRYEKMRETQWFLTPTTCYEDSFSTLCTVIETDLVSDLKAN